VRLELEVVPRLFAAKKGSLDASSKNAQGILMNVEHKTPEWLTFVDHTADAGIAVEAPDLARLFERAAYGKFSVITDLAAARATETSRISIDAPDRVALLVRRLSELNYRYAVALLLIANLHESPR
jgi:hypothetical protein